MAGSKTYRCRAIVLDKTKLGESDLILTLLTDNGAQVRAVAKGARKPGSRLAARCDLACEADLLLARGRNLDVVSQAELLSAPLGPSPDYLLLSVVSAITEVAKLCSYEDAEDHFIFPLTHRALEVVGSDTLGGAQRDLIVAAYVFKLLSHLGYRPDLSACVLCGDEALSYFSATAGGLLCASCASSVPGAEAVGAALISWLRALMGLRFDELAIQEIDGPTSTLLLAFAHSWAAVHLDARLRALEFLLGC